MIKLAAIADDLTGANDTALQFAKKGLRTRVELSSPSVSVDAQCPAEVIAIDADSRDAKTSQVYAQIRTLAEQVKALAPLAVYKKMDSTLRGNWVTEAKAIADVLQPELVIVAPAYPQNGRITVGGFCFLDGHPLELTEIAHAPKNPVQSSYLPHLLQATMPELEVTILRFDKMQQGVEAVREFLQMQKRAGCRWFVADIAEDANFLTLMKAVHGYQNILWVGSAGLAEYLPQFYGWQGHNVPEWPTRNAPIVYCAGSLTLPTPKGGGFLVRRPNLPFQIHEMIEA